MNRAPQAFDDDPVHEENSGAESEENSEEDSPGPVRLVLPNEAEADIVLARSRNLLDRMHEEDREEAIDLHERIEEAILSGDAEALAEASRALTELLFSWRAASGAVRIDGRLNRDSLPGLPGSVSRRRRLLAMRIRSGAPHAD